MPEEESQSDRQMRPWQSESGEGSPRRGTAGIWRRGYFYTSVNQWSEMYHYHNNGNIGPNDASFRILWIDHTER